jgi:peptide/nickel transport system permease protein
MYSGRVVESLTAEQLQAGPLHPYTKALLGAVPDMTRPRSAPLVSIPGQMPSPTSLPGGCPFHPRCPEAIERCATERPPLVARPERGHKVACWVANGDVE